MQKYLIVLLLVLVLLLGFAILNNVSVPINLIFAKFEVALPILIGISVLIGMGLSWIMGLGDKFKKRSQVNELKRQITGLEQQLIDQRKTLDRSLYPTEETKTIDETPSHPLE
ncbi:MAG TPA: LapA family protein [Tissierellia bacterium]|nr:LapA family protein [Tissierellia bacterium]